jgi:predicted adenylyl cyclase CyaB
MDSKINVEVKASCPNPASVRRVLETSGARYVGLDRQRDTYFVVGDGRLKLRQGNIENTLIHYRRSDESGPKPSDVRLHEPKDPSGLLHILAGALEVDVVVEKHRHIYFLENVKVHVDSVPGLGHFVEVEAIGDPGAGVEARLQRQCRDVMTLLGIRREDLIDRSYSDMLREVRVGPRWVS